MRASDPILCLCKTSCDSGDWRYSPDPKFRFAEDYDLMSRLAFRDAGANRPERLGCWRIHKTSASQQNVSQQAAAVMSISHRNICRLMRWDRINPICWEGVERFLYHPVGQKLDLTCAELTRTLDFLTAVHEAFCVHYDLGNRESAVYRRKVFWPWGEHALAFRSSQKLPLHIL